MAVSMADITKLRKMTGAGMMDCKNALTESEGDFDKAVEIIRKKGQAVAAKRSDRETSEGCVLAKSTGDYAAMIALKCETDFVAKNADFVALTQAILDAAIANKCQTLDDVKALPMGSGTIADAIVERSGITGEKTELDGYFFVSGACTAVRSCFLKHAPRGHLRHSLRRSARLRHLYVCVPRMLCLWKRRYDGKGSRTSGRPSQLGRTRHASRHRLRRCPAHRPLCQGIPGRSAHRHGLLGRAVELRQRAVRKKCGNQGRRFPHPF